MDTLKELQEQLEYQDEVVNSLDTLCAKQQNKLENIGLMVKSALKNLSQYQAQMLAKDIQEELDR